MNKEQIKQYYERIEKLLNSAKATYAFSPEEIRQILKWYEHLQDSKNEVIEYIRIRYCNNEDITDCWHPGMSDILDILRK